MGAWQEQADQKVRDVVSVAAPARDYMCAVTWGTLKHTRTFWVELL